MPSGYPGALDSLSTTHADGVNEVIAAATTNDLADAVNKIEAELGVNPSGAEVTVLAALGLKSALLGPQSFSGAQSFLSGAVGTVPVVVQGVASQSADLQQWQNSAGTVLASVGATGAVRVPRVLVGGGTDTGQSVEVNGTMKANIVDISAIILRAGWIQAGGGGALRTDNANVDVLKWSSQEGVGVEAYSAATTVLRVKGFASQTADLQQWQNSAGAVLASVTAAGVMVADPQTTVASVTTARTGGAAATLPAAPVKYVALRDETGARVYVPAYS